MIGTCQDRAISVRARILRAIGFSHLPEKDLFVIVLLLDLLLSVGVGLDGLLANIHKERCTVGGRACECEGVRVILGWCGAASPVCEVAQSSLTCVPCQLRLASQHSSRGWRITDGITGSIMWTVAWEQVLGAPICLSVHASRDENLVKSELIPGQHPHSAPADPSDPTAPKTTLLQHHHTKHRQGYLVDSDACCPGICCASGRSSKGG